VYFAASAASSILERACVFNSSILSLRFTLPHDPVNQVIMVTIFAAPIRVGLSGNGETRQSRMRENLMTGIDEGRQDKRGEACFCFLLYFDNEMT